MLIEPRDPLLVRDGRPFTPDPGSRARTLPFPLPQTLAGVYRARLGRARGIRFPEAAQEVLGWGVRGPLLAELEEAGWRLLAPRPLDAVRLGEAVYPLRPLEPPRGAGTNLPEGLLPLGLPRPDLKAKPSPLPPFWYWESLEAWLLDRLDFRPEGHEGPTVETRFHVAIAPGSGTAAEGRLFQTQGLAFARRAKGGFKRLALVLWPEEEELEGVYPLGGERRLALFARGGPGIPPPPKGLHTALVKTRAARLLFLTPAFLEGAYLPRDRSFHGAQVVAALVGRPQTVSGWDLQKGRPKPSRRAVPAGSVYFLRLPEAWGEGEVQAWLERVWFQNLSDGEQDRKDGYGLAAVGVWNGKPIRWEEV